VATAVAALGLLCGGLAACSDDGPDQKVPGGGGERQVTLAQARTQEQRILDQRAQAVRRRDPALFLRRVDHADHQLMARQRRYYRNLVQLPLQRFRFRVTDRQWEGLAIPGRWGTQVHVPRIRLVTQLADFDAVPVNRTIGLVFSFKDGRATIVSDRTASGKALVEGAQAPWDLTAITVRRAPGVLGVFDRRTRASATQVMDAVRTGIAQLDRVLPFSWSGRVVVYNIQNAGVLGSFTDVPGGSLDHLGALTFPTYAGAEGASQVASTRMLLLPSSISAGQPFLGRITRHELSHVAIGPRDDGAPAWVSEGVAEYLGARELPLRSRIIPTSAIGRSAADVGGMPVSRTFNDSDQEWHYALSWMACDYIASTDGESRIWELVDAMHNGGEGTSDQDQDRVLEQVLGYDSHELAIRAAARIQKIYG
jgi:hypothetical protein